MWHAIVIDKFNKINKEVITMKKAKKYAAILLAVLMIATAFTACGGSDNGGDGKVVMNVALAGDIVRLDPAFAYDNDTSIVIDNICEGLLCHDENNALKCNLAESWEAADPTTYVYHLRQDVKFSDGSDMTVDDVVYSLQRHMDENLGSYMNWFFENVESIEATGDYEVTVKLSQPDANWQYVLATSAGMIVKKDYAEEKGEDFGSADGGIIGTGPFKYESWTSGSKVVLTKNENYWDSSAKTNVDEIDFSIISDDTTLSTALKSGQIDMAANFSTNLLDTLHGYDNVTVCDNPGMGIHYIAFNTAREPFDDINVRKAISYAIDIDSISDNIVKETGTKGGQLPMTDSLFTVEPERWQEYVESLPGHVYDLEKAKEYMAKSSVPEGFSCNVLVSQADSQRYDVALVLQQSLSQIGIDVEVVSVTSDELYSYQFGNILDKDGVRDYDMLVATWGADYPDPSGNLYPLYTTSNIGAGGYNCASYSNKTVDELLSKASVTVDNTERMDLLFEVCDIITEDEPYYVYNYTRNFAVISNDYDYGDMSIGSAWDWNFKNMVCQK